MFLRKWTANYIDLDDWVYLRGWVTFPVISVFKKKTDCIVCLGILYPCSLQHPCWIRCSFTSNHYKDWSIGFIKSIIHKIPLKKSIVFISHLDVIIWYKLYMAIKVSNSIYRGKIINVYNVVYQNLRVGYWRIYSLHLTLSKHLLQWAK